MFDRDLTVRGDIPVPSKQLRKTTTKRYESGRRGFARIFVPPTCCTVRYRIYGTYRTGILYIWYISSARDSAFIVDSVDLRGRPSGSRCEAFSYLLIGVMSVASGE